jgi:hypothetical protein
MNNELELRRILFDSATGLVTGYPHLAKDVHEFALDLVRDVLARLEAAGFELRRATDAA